MKKWQKNQKGVVGWSHLQGGAKSSNSCNSVFGRVYAAKKTSFVKREREKIEKNYENYKNDVEPKAGAGRPNCMDDTKRERMLEAYYSRPYSLRQLGVMFGVSRMTVWRVVQEFGQAPNFVL